MFAEGIAEFAQCFAECDKNENGVLELSEFKTFMDKSCENRRKRFGEAIPHDDREKQEWYDAYNGINSDKEGVSMEDFMKGMGYVTKVMGSVAKMRAGRTFYQLMGNALKRMASYKPETHAKIKEYMEAEEKNPELY